MLKVSVAYRIGTIIHHDFIHCEEFFHDDGGNNFEFQKVSKIEKEGGRNFNYSFPVTVYIKTPYLVVVEEQPSTEKPEEPISDLEKVL